MGDGAVGKTATSRNLMGMQWDEHLQRTNGIHIHGMSLSSTSSAVELDVHSKVAATAVVEAIATQVLQGHQEQPQNASISKIVDNFSNSAANSIDSESAFGSFLLYIYIYSCCC
jgi:hypothetical protein